LGNAKLVVETTHDTIPKLSIGYNKIQGWQALFVVLYKRQWVIDINGYNEELVLYGYDDVEISTRLSAKGIGQFIDKSIQVVHQFHERMPPNKEYEGSITNENIMKRKNYNINSQDNDIIANKRKEWGVIIPKP